MLIVPGAAGEIGVLARHAPLVATLKAGSTRVHLASERGGARARDRAWLLQGRARPRDRARRRCRRREADRRRARAGAARGGEGRAGEGRGGRVDRRPLAARAADRSTPRTSSRSPAASSAVRVAALADVHGNATALAAVLAELEREQPDLIVSCGDLTWGALPRETLALLEPWGDRIAVRPRQLRARARSSGRSLDSEVARWEWEHARRARRCATTSQRTRRTRGRRRRRARPDALLPRLAAQRRGVRDGSRRRPSASPSSWPACTQACVVTAHTHMQYDRRVGQTRLLNPERRPAVRARAGHAYWALLGPEVELRRTPYDLDAALERMRASGDARSSSGSRRCCARRPRRPR